MFAASVIVAVAAVGGLSYGVVSERWRSSNRREEDQIEEAVAENQNRIYQSYENSSISFERAINIVRNRDARLRTNEWDVQQHVNNGNEDEAERCLARAFANELEMNNSLPRLLKEARCPAHLTVKIIKSPPKMSKLESLVRTPELFNLVKEFYPEAGIKLRGLSPFIDSTEAIREATFSQLMSAKNLLKLELMERTSYNVYNFISALVADLIDISLPGAVALSATTTKFIKCSQKDFNAFKEMAKELFEKSKLDPKNWITDEDGNPLYVGPSLQEFIMRQFEKAKLLMRDNNLGDIDYLSDWMNGKVQYIKRNAFFITAVISTLYCCLMVGQALQSEQPPSIESIILLVRQTVSAVFSSFLPLLGVGINIAIGVATGTLFHRTKMAWDKCLETFRSFSDTTEFTFKEYTWMFIGNPIQIALKRGFKGLQLAGEFAGQLLHVAWEYISSFIHTQVIVPVSEFVNEIIARSERGLALLMLSMRKSGVSGSGPCSDSVEHVGNIALTVLVHANLGGH